MKCESRSVVSDSLRPHGLYSPWNSPGQNTGVSSLSLLQGSSQTRDPTQVSHIAGRFFTSWATREAQKYWSEWVAYPFSSRSSRPKNQIRVSCIAGGFFTNCAIREAFLACWDLPKSPRQRRTATKPHCFLCASIRPTSASESHLWLFTPFPPLNTIIHILPLSLLWILPRPVLQSLFSLPFRPSLTLVFSLWGIRHLLFDQHLHLLPSALHPALHPASRLDSSTHPYTQNTHSDLGKFTTWRFLCRGLTVSEYRVIHLAVVIGSKLSLVSDTGLNLGDLRMRAKRNLCWGWERGVRALREAGGKDRERPIGWRGGGDPECLMDPRRLLSVGFLGG